MRKMVVGHRSFALHGKQAAVCVAEETNNCEAVRRVPVSIVNNIGGSSCIDGQ